MNFHRKEKKYSFILLLLILFIFASNALAATSGTVTASSLNMRKSASSDAKVLSVLKEGAKVNIIGSSGNWYKISYGNKTGYVSKSYISTKSSGKSSSSSTSSSGSKVSTNSTLKSGASGSDVKNLQKKLKALGYYSGSITGKYNSATETAVKKFQKAKGLTADGVAGPTTLKAINNAKTGSSSSGSSLSTEKLNWFNGGSNKIPKRATFQVKDCLTGKVFTAKRWSGGNHIDAEPYTASDTKIMKSIYGHWSWRRRPVLVKYNGHVYAGSMNGMPHGTQTVSNNNFDGHFCIHFSGSKTHGSKKVDSEHQRCVKQAMNYHW